MTKKESRSVSGKITALNISPRGAVEGALVETANGPAQVNLPKEGAPGHALRIGAAIELHGEPEHDDGAHPVYLMDGDGAEVEGTVASFNYARHGEVNGVRLDDGTFVHLKPEGAAEHDLQIGERIRAKGRRKVGADAVVVDADEVTRLSASARRRDRAAPRCRA